MTTSFTDRVWNIQCSDFLVKHDVISPIGVKILRNRGFNTISEINGLLNVSLNNSIVDPFFLLDMESATKRLCVAIEKKTKDIDIW